MQKINIVCVGKLKEKFFADSVAESCKRLTRLAAVHICELPARRPLAEAPELISLDVRGACFARAVAGNNPSSQPLSPLVREQ